MMLPWRLEYIGEVKDSPEFQRIRALPRRLSPPANFEKLTELFRLPEAEEHQELWPIQAQALAELHLVGGLVGLIRVGGGKTLISFLAPEMLNVQRPLLLIPAKLREKTRREFEELERYWRKPTASIVVESYERLGRAQWALFLEEHMPDMLICDEAHRLKNVRAAVTRRVGRYMAEHPETYFLALSGTLTRRSLMDFAHLAEWALRDNAPVPLVWADLQAWCNAVDEASQIDGRYRPGPLVEFMDDGKEGLEGVREGVRRRLIETPGVVATAEGFVDASLVIDDWWPDYQASFLVEEALKVLRDKWETPSGDLLMSAADVWRNARELALGFYYRWEPQPPQWWLEPRREWAAFVRKVLLRSRSLDSELQVAQMYEKSSVYQNWIAVRKKYEPNVVPVWIDESIVERAAQWADIEGGIIWVEYQAVAEKLENLGIPYYGNMGLNKNKEPIETATGGIAASVEANKEGRNLQRYNRNLVLSPSTTGQTWEQLLGRTHREGQSADEVLVDVFFGCKENVKAFTQALSDARYQKELTGSPQKLLDATLAFDLGKG